MGRAKIAMEFIRKEKTRNTTYVKRKKGLIKKGHEFSILCNVPVCIIIYPYKEGKQPFEPEVYSFQGNGLSGSNRLDMARAQDPKMAGEIIDRYLAMPKDEKTKRAVNLYDMLDEWKRKADQKLIKLRQKNALAKYPIWNSTLDGFNVDQFMELLVHLDHKLELVKQRIDVTKRSKGDLVPFVEPTNMKNGAYFVDHYSHYHSHQMGCFDLEVFNQVSFVNYPISNGQYCHQIVPFDPMDHGVGNGGNKVLYNMNMIGTSHMHCDQGKGIVDNEGVGSSNGGASLPMSTPLQLPMVFYK